MTVVPNAATRAANSCPIRPSPTTPTVLSAISTPVNLLRFHSPARTEASAAGIFLATASSSASACSAAVMMFDCGALTTSTPRAVAAGTSTLSRPMPALATTLSSGAAASASASIGGRGADQDGVGVLRARAAGRRGRRRRRAGSRTPCRARPSRTGRAARRSARRAWARLVISTVGSTVGLGLAALDPTDSRRGTAPRPRTRGGSAALCPGNHVICPVTAASPRCPPIRSQPDTRLHSDRRAHGRVIHTDGGINTAARCS